MEKPDLEAVLAHYGTAIPAYGSGWRKVLCPVHDESRPSATVNLDLGKWNCFGCGEHGDSLDLIQIKEGLQNAAEAAEFATENGFPFSDGRTPDGRTARPRRPQRPERTGTARRERPGGRWRWD